MSPRRSRPARGAAPTQDFLPKLVERAHDIVFRVRLAPRPRLEYINRAASILTGYTEDEWYADGGALALKIVHPADRRKLADVQRSRRLPAQPITIRWFAKDGSIVRTEIDAQAVNGRQGTFVAIEGIARRMREEADEPAGLSDRFLRGAFEQAPCGLAHLAADGRLLHVNRRLCDICGFSPSELLGKRIQDVSHPDDIDREVAMLQQLRGTDGGDVTVEQRCVRKDGSHAWVKVTACRLRNAGSATDSLAMVVTIPPPSERQEEQHRISYDGIDVDTDRLDVQWNGRAVALTLKEVLLLRYLIRHRGEMLARDRLLRDVWGYEHSGRSRTLDVHVCRLRRKLPPLADSLVTIGHFGYTLAQAPESQASVQPG